MYGTCICAPFPEYRPSAYIFEPMFVVLQSNPYYIIAEVLNKFLDPSGSTNQPYLDKKRADRDLAAKWRLFICVHFIQMRE